MKLEYLASGSDDCPLVRLYDFTPTEIGLLHDAMVDLETGARQSVAVHAMPGVEAISECCLTLRGGSRDRGIVQLSSVANFECILTPDSWGNVAGLVEPFLWHNRGHQWLTDAGDVSWLLSSSGQW